MHRVKYASVGGVLTGKKPGDAVEIFDAEELKHLLDLGLIETEEDAQARALALVSAHDAAKGNPALTEVLTDEQRLEPYAKGGGWYHLPVEGGDPLKLRREDALAELARREAAHAAGQQPSGQ